MSYDVDVGDTVVGNMTSNVSPMWTKALGFRLAEMHQQTARRCIPHLQRAVARISDPDTRDEYVQMNPPNSWGDVASAEQYLRDLLRACEHAPTEKVWVSR